MKKIYEEIKKIMEISQQYWDWENNRPTNQRFKDINRSDVGGSKKQASTSSSNRSTSSVNRAPSRVTSSGPPDGLPKKLLKGVGRLASGLAMADFLGTHGELNTGEKEDLEARRKSDKKYQNIATQQNKPKESGYKDTSGIEYDTEGNPMRDPKAITKNKPIRQASVVRKTVDTSRQTTPSTYFTNRAVNVDKVDNIDKVEPKPEPKADNKVEVKPVSNNSVSSSEPAFPEPTPASNNSVSSSKPAKPEPAKPEPAEPEAKSDTSDLAKEYIKANTRSDSEQKPEDKVKRVRIIKPTTTSESSTLDRIRRIINEKQQVDEVIGASRTAVRYGPGAFRWGYKALRDIFKDEPKPVQVQTRPAPRTEVKPHQQPSTTAPVPAVRPAPTTRPAPATRQQELVTKREVVVKKEPPVKKQELVVVKQEPVPVPVARPAPTRVRPIEPSPAPAPVRVKPVEPAPAPVPVPTVRPSDPAPVPVVKPEAKPQTSTQVVKTTRGAVATNTEPETQSKLMRVPPPPPPPPVDTEVADKDPGRKREIRFPTDPQFFKKEPPPVEPPKPAPQPNNAVPPSPPAPPPKAEPPKPAPQPSNVVPTPTEPKPVPSQTTPECPTGECDPNLDVKSVQKKMASYTPKGFTRREKQQFSMESTQMNINKKFNVSDDLYQSVMEVMSNAKKPGSVPGNEAQRDLAAKHGDPDRITHGDILVARGVVKSNDPVKKSKVAEGTMRNGKYVDDAPRPGTNELPVPDEGYRGPGKPLYTPTPKKTAKKVQPGSTTKVMDDMEESTDTPGNGYQHQCAIHVKSESFGEGRTVTTQHADPDQDGNIAWYDVMFEHGIEKHVPTAELEIVVSESHMHSMKKKKK